MQIVEIILGRYAHGTQTPNPYGVGTLLGCCWHSFLEVKKDGKTIFAEEEKCDEPKPDEFERKLEGKLEVLVEEWDEKLSLEYPNEELEWHDLGDVYNTRLQESVKTISHVNTTHYKATVITYFLP
jgi:hypothetical protein